jgi:hypothetical protein
VVRALDLHDVVFVGHSVSAMTGVLAATREPGVPAGSWAWSRPPASASPRPS